MSKGDKDRLLFPSMGEPTLFIYFRRSTPNICLGNIHLPTENVLVASPKSRFFGVRVVNVPVVVCVSGGGGERGGIYLIWMEFNGVILSKLATN